MKSLTLLLNISRGIFVDMAYGHQRRGASPTPDQEETNGCSLLELPAAPQHFLNSEKVAMGIDPAFDRT
ncbi:MAG: hypothetical protein V7771_18685 [Shewanella psychromarinicola]|uniref:hypothetical protein n=1 Tax=Shewanella psychromarinicola TaxID=2487742 RepID=UPI0030026C0C